MAEAKKALENKSADHGTLKAAFDSLQTVSHKLSEAMYKATGAAPGAGAETADATAGQDSKKSGDDVIDADFKDVN